MIEIDDKKLEKILLEVVQKFYLEQEVYLVIEEIICNLDDKKDNEPYEFFINGRYGENDKWHKTFKDIIIYSDWSWDFIAGYFWRTLETADLIEE